MNKYFLVLAFLFIIPTSVLAGNTTVIRASFTIPQRVEINKESAIPLEEKGKLSEEVEYEIIVEEERMLATEEVARGGQKVLLKTVLVK